MLQAGPFVLVAYYGVKLKIDRHRHGNIVVHMRNPSSPATARSETCSMHWLNREHSTMFWPPAAHFAIIPPHWPQMIKLGLRRKAGLSVSDSDQLGACPAILCRAACCLCSGKVSLTYLSKPTPFKVHFYLSNQVTRRNSRQREWPRKSALTPPLIVPSSSPPLGEGLATSHLSWRVP